MAVNPSNPLLYNAITVIPALAGVGNNIFGKKKKGGPFYSGLRDERIYATQDFIEIFGRNPSEAELATIIPAYVGADQHFPNKAQGKAYVAQLYQAQENTPEKQYARQQEEYRKKAPEHYGMIDQMFQGTVGRGATQEEKDHFGALLASGQLDSYQMGQFLNQLPEVVRKQDEQFRTQLSGELQGQDARYFNEQVLPGISSSFANKGRSIDSSGYAAALAQTANQQNRQRESFLSNLSAAQYGGQTGRAREDYMNTLGRYQGMQDYSRQRSDQLSDQSTNRLYDIQNFNMQKQMYDSYLSRYGKRNPLGGVASGAASGAAAGSYFGPWGTVIGGIVGGATGYFGSR